MNEVVWYQYVFDFIINILPLIGVIIGACLSPWVSFLFEKLKRKRNIKQELIKLIHLFYNHQKMAYRDTAIHALSYHRREVNILQIRTKVQNKIDVDRDIADDDVIVKVRSEKLDSTAVLLTDLEGQMISTIFEIRTLIGKKNIKRYSIY